MDDTAPTTVYLGEWEGVQMAWCYTCRAEHYVCPRCTSRACEHIVALVRAMAEAP